MKKYALRSSLVVSALYFFEVHTRPATRNPAVAMPRLRHYLRNCPTWAWGHARLGQAAIAALETADRSFRYRLLGTAELSATVIEQLTSRSASKSAARLLLVGKILRTNIQFFHALHAESLQATEEILATEQQNLSEQQKLTLFEQAGAAAMSLGLEDKAKFYFSAIPAAYRTATGTAALDYLRRLEEESQAK